METKDVNTQAIIDLSSDISFIQNYLETEGMTQSKLADISGISDSAITQVLKGKYAGNTQGVVKKLKDAIYEEKEKREGKTKKISFVVTSIYEKVAYNLQLATACEQIVVITGEAGIGKTMAIKYYNANHPNTLLIEVDPTYSTNTILSRLAEILGIEPKGRKDKVMGAIVKRLEGTGKLIIVDEAEYLKPQALDILRRIYDMTGCPIALFGMPKLYQNITGASKYEQISSRMIFAKLEKISIDDVKIIAEQVIEKLTERMIEVLFRLCDGNARRLEKHLIIAQKKAEMLDSEITISLLKETTMIPPRG